MLSTASAPTFTDTDSGIIDLNRIDKRAVIIATIANNPALNHNFLNTCFRIHCQREIICIPSYYGQDKLMPPWRAAFDCINEPGAGSADVFRTGPVCH